MKKILVCLFVLFSSFSIAQTLPRSPFVGAEIGTLTDAVRSAYKFKVEKGLIIYRIFPNSAAEKAKLQEKDVILTVNEQRMERIKTFQDLLRTKQAGDTLAILFVRNDTIQKTDLVLHFLPREYSFFFDTVYDQVALDSLTHLRTILTVPKNGNKFPVVCLFLDISNESIESLKAKKTVLYEWVDSLTRNGFATLRIERKGIGDSEGSFEEWTVENELNSILLAKQALQKYTYIDTTKVYAVALGASTTILLNFIENKRNLFCKVMLESIPIFKQIYREDLCFHYPKLRSLNENYLIAYQNIFAHYYFRQHDLKQANNGNVVFLTEKHPITQVLSSLQQD